MRHFHPVVTERNIARINETRLISNMIEASQQCERFDIPTLFPLASLTEALSRWDPRMPLLVCWERGDVPSIAHALQTLPPKASIGFLMARKGVFLPRK